MLRGFFGGGVLTGDVPEAVGTSFDVEFLEDVADGGICILAEFAFPDGDDGPGEGVEALGVEFVAGDAATYFGRPNS